MPSRVQKSATSQDDIIFWQLVWKYFMKLDFVLIPKQSWSKMLIDYNYLHVDYPGGALQRANGFAEVINLLTGLISWLKGAKVNYSSIKWNYLGTSREKESFLGYLCKTFWQNQSDENLQKLENYRNILEHPWKVANYLSKLDWDVKPPVEFFADRTIDFFGNLEKQLGKWELDPYFIVNDRFTFHWQIENEERSLLGGVYSKNDILIHEIYFIDK